MVHRGGLGVLQSLRQCGLRVTLTLGEVSSGRSAWAVDIRPEDGAKVI